VRISYAMVFVTDMARSVKFYRDVVGLPLKFESPYWTEFATEGTTLALHPTTMTAPAPPAGDGEPAGTCRIGFSVADLDALHAKLVAAGVTCVQPPREQSGARISTYRDPDGLTFAASQDPR
jgi:lactoylglutathione lyase